MDRVPVAPYMGNHGARVAGVPIGEYCRSGRLMAEAQYRAWQVYGQDAVVAQLDNYYIAEGFRVEVEHYPDGTPTLRTPAISGLDGVQGLRVPDPRKHGRMPVYLEAISRLAGLTRGEVAVRAPGTGPFSLASHLMGTEKFLIEVALAEREPGGPAECSLKRLLELTTEALILFAKACLEAGARLVQAINPLAERCGAATVLHICGNMTAVLELMADTGAHILELDHKVRLSAAKGRVGHRVCLMGNLDPVELLWRGSPAAVNCAAAQAITDTGGRGFILGSGCELPVEAPRENVKAMIRAAHATGSREG